jgi:hypothetical protein
MTATLRMLDPVSCGERKFYPVVRDSIVSCEQGMAVSVNPVAVLFFDAGTWMFVPLEEGTNPDILQKLS